MGAGLWPEQKPVNKLTKCKNQADPARTRFIYSLEVIGLVVDYCGAMVKCKEVPFPPFSRSIDLKQVFEHSQYK
ncbi:unnamed protein product [Nippostrongylus brasiliensis]|uniref:Uncharacterized protein n=1 Tax=Nippostrongylus brasiliensis TaxID=27835 RepID=A0A0N4XJR5_NIPBR|nr:unnamed protein product [Nippostrongylus brasiliensis]